MDDAMIDLTAGDALLRGRLEAYADARLSPDLTATSRIRARVLAVAHRQADLARADAALAVLPRPAAGGGGAMRTPAAMPGRAGAPWRRAASALLAACLGLTLMVGTALATRPGGPLYDVRLWAETLLLPDDPSARAVGQLDRLTRRLDELVAASQSGDPEAAAAALAAYEAIMFEASTRAIIADDPVASAALEAGVARNIEVLQALVDRLPDRASVAITDAIERAIVRSDDAVDAIHDDGRAGGGNGGKGTGGGDDGGGATEPADGVPTSTPRPTKEPVIKPTKAPTPEPALEPTGVPKPDKTPPAFGRSPEPPGAGGGGESGGD